MGAFGYLRTISIVIVLLLTSRGVGQNILLIIADDLNYNSLGFTGCSVENISPNLDSLATKSLVFDNFFVSTSNCHPSRQSILTGKYPQNYGSQGFNPIGNDNVTITEALKAAGYFTGMIGKIGHAKPYEKFPWDFKIDKGNNGLALGRSPSKFKISADQFFETVPANQPYFLVINSSDPHRPFANSLEEKIKLETEWSEFKKPELNRIITPGEVELPSWLPEEERIKVDYADYYTSVFRLDETVGKILNSLKRSKFSENTIVIFLSDHGAPFPLAKANVYLNSIRSPFLIYWPNNIEPRVDSVNFVSAVDLMPTILDLLNIKLNTVMDGHSFKEAIFDQRVIHSKTHYALFDETAGERSFRMRSVTTPDFHYIYNFWSDGRNQFKFGPGLTFEVLDSMSHLDSTARAIYVKTSFRTKEELYAISDADNLTNLTHLEEYRTTLDNARALLKKEMLRFNDPFVRKLSFETMWCRLYPVPAKERIYYEANLTPDTFFIYNNQGAEVMAGHNPERSINIQNLSKGIYIIEFRTDQNVVFQKFIKE